MAVAVAAVVYNPGAGESKEIAGLVVVVAC